MAINIHDQEKWNADIKESVRTYNEWFQSYTPKIYYSVREASAHMIDRFFVDSNNMTELSVGFLQQYPHYLGILRLAAAPPVARDRLKGLSQIQAGTLIKKMEESQNWIMSNQQEDLERMLSVISKLLDRELFGWIAENRTPSDKELLKAKAVLTDRMSASRADSIIRNSQEKRQLDILTTFLDGKGYTQVVGLSPLEQLKAGQYTIHSSLFHTGSGQPVAISIDLSIRSKKNGQLILLEAKSAGDFVNVNKRRKEEAQKFRQIMEEYGDQVQYLLFLGGYFDERYLQYMSSEGMDWLWEHKQEDLEKLNL